MKLAKRFIAILVVLLMAAALYSCGSDSGTSKGDEGSEDKWVSYTIGVSQWLGGFIDGLNPGASHTACNGVFDTIFKINPATKKMESRVLKNWYWEDDLTFVCEMRDDVYFSNGEKATAEDVLYSYSSMMDRGSYYLDTHGIIFEDSYCRDDYTVVFKVQKHYPDFEDQWIFLICKSWAESRANGWLDEDWYYPVGSGPYSVYEYVSDGHITLRSRGDDNYWYKDEGSIYVDEWVIRYYPDSSSLYMALQSGEVDYADVADVDYNRYMEAGGNFDGFKVAYAGLGSTLCFTFNFVDSDLWHDKSLREAVAIGVNWDEVGEIVKGASFVPSRSVASVLHPDYIEAGKYDFNPERARELMEAAGYGPGNPLRLSTITIGGGTYESAFVAIQYYMSDIYIDLSLDLRDNTGAIGSWFLPGNDVGIWFSSMGHPEGKLPVTLYESGRGEAGIRHAAIPFPEFMEQWEIINSSPDAAARSQANKTIQQLMFDEIWYIPFGEWGSCFGWRTDKFTEEQITSCRGANNMFFIGRLGLESYWK